MSGLSWAQTREIPGRLNKRAAPNFSDSVLFDPDKAGRKELKEIFELATNLLPAKLGGLGAMGLAGIIKKPGGAWSKSGLNELSDILRAESKFDPETVKWIRSLKEMGGDTWERTYQDMIKTQSPRLNEVNEILESQKDPFNLTRNRIIDTRILPYVRGHLGAETDPIRKFLSELPDRKLDLAETKLKQIQSVQQKLDSLAEERGVPEEVLTRTRARLNQLNSELTEIKELGNLSSIGAQEPAYLRNKRNALGMPEEDVSTGASARNWERSTDDAISAKHVEDPVTGKKELEYDFSRFYPEAQMTHMLDELHAASSPEFGLPKHLLKTGPQLENMSIQQLYQHADAVNAYRRALKAEADKGLANKAAHPYMEFPDDPKGMRWVELKSPENLTELPSSYEIVGDTGSGFKYRLKQPDSYGSQRTSPPFSTREEALQYALGSEQVRAADLQDALRYEGDQLAHCVGSYCNKTASGQSRILSLRDSSGKPHVTIEIQKSDPRDYMYEHSYIQDAFEKHFSDRMPSDKEELEWLQKTFPKEFSALSNDLTEINQIKGYNNSTKHSEEILPYIQQIVKREKLGFSHEGKADFNGTKLFDVQSFRDRPNFSHPFPIRDAQEMRYITNNYPTPNDMLKTIEAAHPEERYITYPEFRKVFGLDE